MKAFLKRFCANRGAAVGLAVLLAVIVVGALAPLLYEESPWMMVGPPLLAPFTDPPSRWAPTCWAATSPPA